MLKKEITAEKLKKSGIVVVIRSDNAQKAIKTAEACIRGGIRCIEITFTVPRPHRVIEDIVEEFSGEDVVIGAGTVLDSESARVAMLSGADFIVSPTADEGMIRMCNRYGILSVSGAQTPADIQRACECGAGMIKLFPATALPVSTISCMHGPFPNTDFMVTGTMDEKGVYEWLKNGAAAVGIGSSITKPAENNDFDEIARRAGKYSEIAAQAVRIQK